MCKIKSWVVDEKKHVRYYQEWNEKEVEIFFLIICSPAGPMFLCSD